MIAGMIAENMGENISKFFLFLSFTDRNILMANHIPLSKKPMIKMTGYSIGVLLWIPEN